MEWISVAPIMNWEIGERRFVDVYDKRILVVRLNEGYYALESMCTHAMFELDEAEIEKCELICPLHGARFSIKTGEVLGPPAYEDLITFPTRVENNEVQIGV